MAAYLLIGGIGAGKSSVAALFVAHGAAHVDLDAVGHEVLEQTTAQLLLADAFGPDILRQASEQDGRVIDRAALAAHAFASPSATKRLNAIVHPLIEEATLNRLEELEASGCPLIIVEASAYNGPDDAIARLQEACQGVIAVCAPEDVRLARACARGLSEQDVRARMSRQPSDAERLNWADFVISNTSDKAVLEAQVESLMPILIQKRYGKAVEGGC